jgi:LAO/AO transport system kinase
MMLAPAFNQQTHEIAIIKTVASQKEGITELYTAIVEHVNSIRKSDKKFWLLAEKAFYLIQQKRMKGIDKKIMKAEIEQEGLKFNLYTYIKKFI